MSSSHTPTSWPAPSPAARCPHQQWTAWSSPPGWCPVLSVQPQSYQPAKSGSTRPRPLHNVWLHWCSQWHCRWHVEHPWRTLAWLEGEERPRTTILLLFPGTCCKKGAFNLSHKPFERILKLMEHALYKQMPGRVKNTLTCTYTCMMCHSIAYQPLFSVSLLHHLPLINRNVCCMRLGASAVVLTHNCHTVFVHWYTLTQKWCTTYHIAGKSTGKWHTYEQTCGSVHYVLWFMQFQHIPLNFRGHACVYLRPYMCFACVDSICRSSNS